MEGRNARDKTKVRKENIERRGWLSGRGWQLQPQGQASEARTIMSLARRETRPRRR